MTRAHHTNYPGHIDRSKLTPSVRILLEGSEVLRSSSRLAALQTTNAAILLDTVSNNLAKAAKELPQGPDLDALNIELARISRARRSLSSLLRKVSDATREVE
ncbi:MAG: hypothetical protein KGH94_04445 [Candidatus Micrarchaeota archaeon]|nr:hypothetical protein [Candidatus Micrarchaeota archaeon]